MHSPSNYKALGLIFFSMFVPDLLHEFELGVWKNTFKHLIRILYAVGNDLIQELNSWLAQSKFLRVTH